MTFISNFPPVPESDIEGKPYITVSAKGLANGLSDIMNDGADFGPDTPYGYGNGFTHTSGIQEAYNFLGTNGGGVIKLKAGTYNISDILYLQYSNTKIVGEDMASTVLHLAYPFNALGSGGFQNVNSIVTTDPTGTAQPEYTGIENVTLDASEAGNAKAAITVLMPNWGSHITFRNIRMVGLNGTSPNPNGINGGVDFLTIENYIAKSSDYVQPGSICGTLVLTGGSNITVRNVYMDGLWEFDGDSTPNSTYENIIVNGNNILMDGSGTSSWGYTTFRNVKVFNSTFWAVNGRLQTNEGCYFINCYFEGAVNVAARHTYNCEFNGGVVGVMDFRNNWVYQNGSLLNSLAAAPPIEIKPYKDAYGNYVAYIIGNTIINTGANSQGGSMFTFGGFNASNASNNILTIKDNIFLGPGFNGLFSYTVSTTSLVLIIENNTGPFLSTIQNTAYTPNQITALPGSLIRNNNCLYPTYPFSGSTVSIPANPPVSGTVYQNTNPFDIEINLPVYASTSGTNGSVAYGISNSSTVTLQTAKFVSGSTSSSAVEYVIIRVPAWWYFEFSGTGVTFGTATVKAAQP
jgi:hypothetical protein